jgi:uncharacterized protein YecA (UPF0149 family)
MPDDDIELTPEENDRFWLWLKESGELAALNAMFASMPDEPEPGRNDPCPCGSGKKYKKCCGFNV